MHAERRPRREQLGAPRGERARIQFDEAIRISVARVRRRTAPAPLRRYSRVQTANGLVRGDLGEFHGRWRTAAGSDRWRARALPARDAWRFIVDRLDRPAKSNVSGGLANVGTAD